MKGNSINVLNSFIKFIISFGVTILITRPGLLQNQVRHSLYHLNNYSLHNTTQKIFPSEFWLQKISIICCRPTSNETSQAVWTVCSTFHSLSHILYNPQHFQQLPALTLKGVRRLYDPYHNSAPRKGSVEYTWIIEEKKTSWMIVLDLHKTMVCSLVE